MSANKVPPSMARWRDEVEKESVGKWVAKALAEIGLPVNKYDIDCNCQYCKPKGGCPAFLIPYEVNLVAPGGSLEEGPASPTDSLGQIVVTVYPEKLLEMYAVFDLPDWARNSASKRAFSEAVVSMANSKPGMCYSEEEWARVRCTVNTFYIEDFPSADLVAKTFEKLKEGMRIGFNFLPLVVADKQKKIDEKREAARERREAAKVEAAEKAPPDGRTFKKKGGAEA
jgi:hypothetical protein